LDRLRLTSTRVLGHGPTEDGGPDNDDDPNASLRPRRHILVTGGFGSLGKHVVRDMLLGISSGVAAPKMEMDGWGDDATKEEDILITILDVKDRTSELNHLLQSAPLDKGPKIKGTDPRTQAFTSSERSVDNFKRAGELRVLVGDVRDKKLIAGLLAPGGTTLTEIGNQQVPTLPNAKGRPSFKGPHLATTVVIPPVSGIIHLASYSPAACRLNPTDCENVETDGMAAMLDVLEREGMDKPATLDGQKAVYADRPWIVVPRRGDMWDEVSELEMGVGERKRELMTWRLGFCRADPRRLQLECLEPLDRTRRRAHQGLLRPPSSPLAPPPASLRLLHHR
jgi:hypothetical protein